MEIPAQLKSSLVTKGIEDKKHALANLVGEQLVGCGFNEIINNSLTKSAYYEGLKALHAGKLVRILNPLSSDLNVMRQTLLFGGLESIAHNVNRRNANLKFFERGNVYTFSTEKHNNDNPVAAYREENMIALWVTGKRVSGSWAHQDEQSTFFELKAYVMNILARIGVPFGMLVFKESQNDIFAKATAIGNRDGKLLVEMGIVSKPLLKSAGIDQEVYYAELNWTALMKAISKHKVEYREISKFPAVSRDLALLIDKDVDFAEIEKVAYQSERKILQKVELFDVYEGRNLPDGKKSYAVNFMLQDEQKTLDDKQIDNAMNRIIANLKKQIGAELR